MSDNTRPILVLDDDASFRSFITELLRSRGLNVKEATSASEATAIVDTLNPLMAIVDYRLPTTDGVTWISQMRDCGKNLPVVFLSATWCDEKTFNWLRNILRVSLILNKPIVPELFIQQIEGLLPVNLFLHSARTTGPQQALKPSQVLGMMQEACEGEQPLKRITTSKGVEPAASKSAQKSKLDVFKEAYLKGLTGSWLELSNMIREVRKDPNNGVVINEAAMIAHKIGGTAGSIGLAPIGDTARKIEDFLHGIDPTDTLLEVLWTEIFRELAKGETLIQENVAAIGGSVTNVIVPVASKLLLLGKESYYNDCTRSLGTECPVAVDVSESLAGVRQRIKRTIFDAVILDLAIDAKERIFELAKEIRMSSEHHTIPIGFVNQEAQSPTDVDLLFAGSSVLISENPTKADLEVAIDKLLSFGHSEKPRVLTVDDDELLINFISSILTKEGIIVHTLNKPIIILDILEEFKPDLVLLDVMMPGLSGYDVCRMIRNHAKWQNLPVLFLTSKSDLAGRSAAFEAGGNDFLIKPVIAEELTSRVKDQIALKSQRAGKPKKDQLTGALEGKDFMTAANDLLVDAQYRSLPFTLCLLSIDDFTNLSTVHSWFSAHQALGVLGKLIRCHFASDILRGRLGQDGFVLAFIGRQKEVIGEAMNRLLKEFAALDLTSDNVGNFKTTFSAGVAEYPNDADSFQPLLNVANQRLQNIKRRKPGMIATVG